MIADIAVEGIDGSSRMQFDEIGFSTGDDASDNDTNTNAGKTVFRLISSTAEGPLATRSIVRRLVGEGGQPVPPSQLEWRIYSIKIWKVTLS